MKINTNHTNDDDMKAAIMLDSGVETLSTSALLKIRATWLGQIAPEAGNEIDSGYYKYTQASTPGEAVAEMYDWLLQATLTGKSLNVAGQSKPTWVINALDKIADSKTLSKKIKELRLELADATEARISGVEKEDLLAAIVGKTKAKTEEEIYAELVTVRNEFEALPDWAQRASYKND